MDLLEFMGINNDDLKVISKPKAKNKTKTKKTNKKVEESSVQIDLFNFTQEIMKENKKKVDDFKKVKNVLNTIKVPKTTIEYNEIVVELLDLIMNKENLSNEKEQRYQDNLKAIRTLNSLNDRLANEKEQKILAKYVGWGGLSNKFENIEEDAKLQVLLGKEYKNVKSTVLTSFYTPKTVINFMWKVLERLGFEKGRILEPSCGTGRFLGFMPSEMYEQSKVTCVEIDNVSANITKNLYQSSKIICSPFEDVELKDESFDLIISNIPFGSQTPYGKSDKELNEHKFKIHDYYFLKALKKVRVGGIIAFLTSSGTMDKRNDELRDILSTECNLLGAVRLPSGSFVDTQVTTDIIFLQKTDKEIVGPDWCHLIEKDNMLINEYFINNPNMVLGKMELTSGQFGPVQVCNSDEPINSKLLQSLLKHFPKEIYTTPLDDSYMYEENEVMLDVYNLVEGEFIIHDNNIYQKQMNKLVPYSVSGINKDKIFRFVNIKQCIKCLINMQLELCTDEELKLKQVELEKLYDSYVIRYGHINNKNNSKILSKDTRFPLVSSIELFDNDKGKYYKAQIFTTRTIGVSNILQPETIEDALLVSLSNNGILDLEDVSNRINKPLEITTQELLDKGLIYVNVENEKSLKEKEYLQYDLKEVHISGYIKDRFKTVKASIQILKSEYEELDEYQKWLLSQLKTSYDILEINQPEYVSDVYFELQSSWIPLNIKEKFINKTFNTSRTKLLYTKELGYAIDVKEYVSSSLKYYELGTTRVDAEKILKACLNMTNIVVKDELVDGSKIKNIKETQLANDKKEQWKMLFDEYINDNPAILKELLDLYNEKFINYKERKYENILFNLQINPLVNPREHQLRGASRIITSQNNTLLFHSVGSGKTYTMIIASQEMNRLSKIGGKRGSKNLFIIPNHMCQSGQFAKDYLTIYPQANILATTSNDFTATNRRRLLSKIMTSNWDAVIIPHSVLGMIELKPETEKELIELDIEEIENAEEYYKNQPGNHSTKRLEEMKIKFLDRLKELDDIRRDESGIYWEDLGIDNIFIDEAHNFKNLYFKTRLNVPGVGGTTAKKTRDLYNKIRYHRSIHGEKGIIFATATPISNSMSEIYIMMKYLSEGVLHNYGFNCFDEWASSYGKVVTNMEVNPTGKGFRFKESFSKFNNVPELMQLFRHSADIINIKDIDDIKLPKIYSGAPINIEVEPTPQMLDYVDELVKRAELISQNRVKPDEDNMLMVVNDGRKMAVCPYLVGLNGDSPKINKLVENLTRLYNSDNDSTHAVFCDLGTPKKKKKTKNIDENSKENKDAHDIVENTEIDLNDALDNYSFKTDHNVYQEIKDKLIDNGVNTNDIVFIHDYEKPEKKKQMFDDFNSAKVRILIGSTSKMGEGANIQRKLKSLHHICTPWKPSAIEQREGRIVRQKNLNEEVEIYRYVVNNSFDAYSWQLLERKATYIAQILTGSSTERTIDDVDVQLMGYAATKACACGDERIMKLHQLKSDLQKLHVLEKSYKDKKIAMLNKIKDHEKSISFNENKIKLLERDLKYINENTDEKVMIVLGGKTFNDKQIDEAVEVLGKITKSERPGIIGYLYGTPIRLTYENNGFGKEEKCIKIGESYPINLGYKTYPKVMFNELMNYKVKVEQNIKLANGNLKILKGEIKQLNESIDKPFLRSDELKELKLKVSSLEKELSLEENVA